MLQKLGYSFSTDLYENRITVLTLDTRSLASADILTGNRRSTLAIRRYVSMITVNCAILKKKLEMKVRTVHATPILKGRISN